MGYVFYIAWTAVQFPSRALGFLWWALFAIPWRAGRFKAINVYGSLKNKLRREGKRV